jgi:hypothetical protein
MSFAAKIGLGSLSSNHCRRHAPVDRLTEAGLLQPIACQRLAMTSRFVEGIADRLFLLGFVSFIYIRTRDFPP